MAYFYFYFFDFHIDQAKPSGVPCIVVSSSLEWASTCHGNGKTASTDYHCCLIHSAPELGETVVSYECFSVLQSLKERSTQHTWATLHKSWGPRNFNIHQSTSTGSDKKGSLCLCRFRAATSMAESHPIHCMMWVRGLAPWLPLIKPWTYPRSRS